MSPARAAGPHLDRLLLQPEELRDPGARFTKSLYGFVTVATATLELILGFLGLAYGHPESILIHGLLALVAVGSVGLLKNHFQPIVWAVGLWVLAWTSSSVSLAIGLGMGALLWHLFLPSVILLLRGGAWGAAALVSDIVLTAVHQTLFFGRFGSLSSTSGGQWMLVAWEAISICLYLLFFCVFRLVRQTQAGYQAEQGKTLDLLTQTKDSEARWADQARFLETLMDVIPFPLFHKGTDGTYLSTNASFRVVFDVPKEAVTGKRNEDFLGDENARTLAKIELDLMARDSMAVEEAVLTHADGHLHNFIVYLMPFVDANQAPLGSIGVLIDITDRKIREEKLVRLNDTKDQLFSIISHDLRGPVGKLKQLLDIYMDDPGIFDKATWDQVFHDMRRSADSLFQLLENLLSWARTQQGHDVVRFESIALDPIVADVFAVLKLLATDKRVALEMDLNLNGPLLTDRHVLATILRNLVHNALKFTNSGGKIVVTAGETLDDLWIEVRDNGIGMTPEVLDRLFRKRERISTFGTGKEKGQGIGLGLCQDLAFSLGAVLEAESALGEGTAIRIHLPTQEL